MGKGHEEYIANLRKLMMLPNTGADEYDRGIQEGIRRERIELINAYERIK